MLLLIALGGEIAMEFTAFPRFGGGVCRMVHDLGHADNLLGLFK